MTDELKFELPWASAAERLKDPKSWAPRKPIAKFGVRFLDKALGGIFEGGVILVGARTGSGKTEFVSILAQNLALAGKKVLLMALEADREEIERRILYKKMANKIYAESKLRELLKSRRFQFDEWSRGDFPQFDQLASELAASCDELKTLFTSYRTRGDFTHEDLKNQLHSASAAMDCVILDHIHYVDIEGGEENSEMKKIIKMIRETALIHKKPIIVVAHLRKPQGKSSTIVPDLEEFHGSSDLSKIATQAIMLSPSWKHERGPVKYPTYMRVAKNRMNGSVTSYCALVNFDIALNSYEDDYELGHLNFMGTEWTPISDLSKLPSWATREW